MMFKLVRNNNGAQLRLQLQLLKFPLKLNLYLYSTSPQTNPTFQNYLIQSLGFSEHQSLSTCAKLTRNRGSKKVIDFNFLSNANSVVNLFKNYSFDDAHIRKIVSSEPGILISNVDKTLTPKIEFFREQGFSGSDLIDSISSNPRLLLVGLNSSTVPAFRVLREVLGSDNPKDVVSVLKKSSSYTLSAILRNLVPNVGLLRSCGIPLEFIRKRFFWQPNPFLRTPMCFEAIVISVEEKLGIPRGSPSMFLTGIHLLASLSEKNIDSKCDIFRSFGWTSLDIASLLRKYPLCFGSSEVKINRMLEFLMNELGYEAAWLAAHPFPFFFSLEKRILPRHQVFLVLKDKGLIKADYPFHRILRMSESLFQKQFVVPYKDVREVYAVVSNEKIALLNS